VSFALFLFLIYIVAFLENYTPSYSRFPFSTMRTGYAFLAALSSLTSCARANFYLQDEWIGDGFFQGWIWETMNDPTHGRVNYVDLDEALSKNLTYADNGKFFMRADDWSMISPSARGRDSIRISSEKAYDEAMFVLDIEHMPTGCGTWPAFWTLSKAGPWPNGGEIDIIEGVHEGTNNRASLHTTPNCKMPPEQSRQPQSGNILNSDCDAAVKYNEGCGVEFSDPFIRYTSYGAPFNLAGGGYFAMYKGRDAVKIWSFPRRDYPVPPMIRDGASVSREWAMDLDSWGDPDAHFPFDPYLCDYKQHFDAHQMVFDLTFCGDWAGSVWPLPSSGCAHEAATCEDFVNNNPSRFHDAYWVINSLRVYTPEARQ